MKVFWLRVFNRADRSITAIFGTDAAGVIRQDDTVYAKYPDREYFIERGVLNTNDYTGRDLFPDAPASGSPQEWAEFMLTPGGPD